MKNLINALFIIGLVIIIVGVVQKILNFGGLSIPIPVSNLGVFILGNTCILSALALDNITK